MLNDSVRLPFGTSGALERDRLVRKRWIARTLAPAARQQTTKGEHEMKRTHWQSLWGPC
jgi:hypothetical protein